jgi:hypothetical protein
MPKISNDLIASASDQEAEMRANGTTVEMD